MSSEENKTVIRKFLQAIENYFQTGTEADLDNMLGYLSNDVRHHGPNLPSSKQELKQMLPMFYAGFPGLKVHLEAILCEGNMVADYVTVTAVHTGNFMGIPPSGKEVRYNEMHIQRVENGKITERWSAWDQMGLMQQIGAIPAPQQAEAATT